jgi:hypothetical protein
MKSKLTILIFMLFSAIEMFPQEDNIIPGEVLIQLRHGSNELSVAKNLAFIDLKPVQLLSARMNIWLYSYNENKIAAQNVINRIYEDPNVSVVQFNHKVELRSAKKEFILIFYSHPFIQTIPVLLNNGH